MNAQSDGNLLLSVEDSRALDAEAQAEWGFNAFALIEAAGRLCADALVKTYPGLLENKPRITVAAGAGNNAADAMVMLRYYILSSLADASLSGVVVSRMPKEGETGPWVELLHSLEKMKVPVLAYGADDGLRAKDVLARSDIIIDAIAGTGLSGALRGTAASMAEAVNTTENSVAKTDERPLVVSVDLPSGLSEQWEPGMPIVKADLTLAIEPQKYCIYTPAARPYAGRIVPVRGVFPKELTASYRGYRGAELLEWESAREKIIKVRPDAYKNERGTVEIRAGSPGATGAAVIAGRGAQAAGAGMIRLVVDDGIYPIVASRASSGIMVVPSGVALDSVASAGVPPAEAAENNKPGDAVLLGPGWGRAESRAKEFERALAREKAGAPLILDADAIELARGVVFNGNTILTPHPGEFSNFSGIDKEELLRRPAAILLEHSRKCNAVIVFKGHVITIAAPDGRLGVVDGMLPGLASGGSGDLLAGLCAGIAARMNAGKRARDVVGNADGIAARMARRGGFDAYDCAAAAAALLIASGGRLRTRFTDPLEIAHEAANLAGEAWLASYTC
ncbi:MAG: NAD(P)H-hydrate dehydratase [Treponema sp.]|jgi:NAD(P)H-hydrate epimerase|nr:NAD(P)H-hydrate dehydratase [Treponema sp.]